MISYETFKEYVKEELILRLPPEFAHCRLAEDVIYKVNCRLDALRVMLPEAEKKHWQCQCCIIVIFIR